MMKLAQALVDPAAEPAHCDNVDRTWLSGADMGYGLCEIGRILICDMLDLCSPAIRSIILPDMVI